MTFRTHRRNRGFFPVISSNRAARDDRGSQAAGHSVIAIGPETPGTARSNPEEAKKSPRCSAPIRDKIDGVIVTLPNFVTRRPSPPDYRPLRMAELGKPCPDPRISDTRDRMTIADRRTAFAERCRLQ